MHGRSQFVSEETLRKYKYGRSRADNADFPGNPSASEEDKEKQYGFQDHFYKRRKIQIELDKGERFKKFKHRKSRVDSDNVSEFSDDSATSDEEKRFTYDDGMPSGLNDSEKNGERACNKNVSISSEASAESCTLKHRPISYQQLWEKEDIIISLTNLPAGEAALATLPTLCGDTLDKALDEIRGRSVSPSPDLSALIPRFANGCIRKASLIAENEAAMLATPSELLIKWPNTCLLVACWLGHTDIVKVLLEKGAQVSCRDSDGRTGLHLAASKGWICITEELLKYGADPGDWDFNRKCTPLHCAAAAADVDTVQCLVKAGADINAGLSGKSPLHYAVQNNAEKCVEVLLQAGASPNNPQVYTETPLHVAASLGSVGCVKLLLSHGADVRVQFGAARSTPLHLAAEEGSAECTKLLIEAGALPDAKNSRGQTALHLAALAQSAETLEILIAAKATINAEDGSGRTPLHAAVAKAVRGNEIVKILINAGASVNKPDKFGYTPLHIAALNESSLIVMLLLTKGADVTARTKGGVSALSFIVRRTPDVIPQFVSRLDEAIALHDHELGDVDCELRLDYRPLVPGGRGESDLMLCLVEVGQRHILKHPLCESFLHLKWLKIRKFFLFSLIFHSIFVAVFTGYIIVTFLPSLNNPHLSQLFFWFVLMFTLILAFKEIFQVAHGIWVYAKGWENVLQWSVILTSAMVLSRPVSDWQHHVAALGSLFVWLELMMVVGRFPMFGIFVQMFTQVTINFLKFVGAYLCPIVGFSLAFCVLHTNYNPFKNPLVGLLKTIIMLSGELEFEDIFFDDKMENHDRKIKDLEDKNLTGEDFGEPILYAGTSHCMFLAFVILVTVILANLMMGLAVSDIQELRRNAGLDRLVRRAELVAHLESLLFSKLLDYAPKKILKACRSSALLLHLPHHCAIHIRPNDPREKRFPKEIIKSIYRLVSGKKTKAKSFGNNSVNSSNDNGFGSNRIRRLYSTSSFNDSCQHFSDLAIEFKKFSLNIESRLDTLTVKVDTIAKEINSITSYQKRNK